MSCLTIYHILKLLSSIFIIGYIDDVTFGGPREIGTNDVNSVISEGTNIGLHLNTDKSELITKTQLLLIYHSLIILCISLLTMPQ